MASSRIKFGSTQETTTSMALKNTTDRSNKKPSLTKRDLTLSSQISPIWKEQITPELAAYVVK